MEMSSHIAVLESENPRAMHPSSCFAARLTRSAKDPVPYSREALKQDLLRVRTCVGSIAKPGAIETRFMDISTPCSIS